MVEIANTKWPIRQPEPAGHCDNTIGAKVSGVADDTEQQASHVPRRGSRGTDDTKQTDTTHQELASDNL